MPILNFTFMINTIWTPLHWKHHIIGCEVRYGIEIARKVSLLIYGGFRNKYVLGMSVFSFKKKKIQKYFDTEIIRFFIWEN